jgi:hypothetical protein
MEEEMELGGQTGDVAREEVCGSAQMLRPCGLLDRRRQADSILLVSSFCEGSAT